MQTFFMAKTATLSTILDAAVKEAAVQFCKRRGLKLRSFVEQAVIEQLEDEIDLEAYHARHSEDTIPLEEVVAGRKARAK